MTGNPHRRLATATLSLALLLALPACDAVQQVDSAMRRVDVLDRIFEPERRQPLAPAPPLPTVPAAAPGTPAPADNPPVAALPEDTPILAEPLPSLPSASARAGRATLEARAAPGSDVPASPVARTGRDAAPAPAVSDPAQRTASLLRQSPWLARFWAELTRAQQGRVADRLQAGRPPMLRTEIATAWDRMGLDDRVRLIYGGGAGA